MKKVSKGKRNTVIAAAGIFGIALMAFAITWLSTASANQRRAADKYESQELNVFYTHIRNGLGSVQFATSTSDKAAVSRSVESVAAFIQNRSGLELSESTRQQLETLELQALSGENRRSTAEELADVLTITATKRLAALTNEQIDEIASTLSQGSGALSLRANGAGYFQTSELVNQARAMRNLAQKGDEGLHNTVRAAVGAEINRRLQTYSEALPESFGTATEGMTPLQALLVTYSVAADDQLGGTQASLRLSMTAVGQSMEARGSTLATTSDKAYGTNGYLFSTPLHLIFDETTTNQLLGLLGERSGK